MPQRNHADSDTDYSGVVAQRNDVPVSAVKPDAVEADEAADDTSGLALIIPP